MIARNGICTITEVARVPPRRANRHSFWRDFLADIVLRLEKTPPPRALRLEFPTLPAAQSSRRTLVAYAKETYGSEFIKCQVIQENDCAAIYVQRGKNWRRPD